MQPVQIEKGGQLPAGTYNIPYIASDSAGNTATCELVIIVTDYPTLICPLDITAETAPGEPTASVFWEAPVITDGGDNGRIPDPDIPPGDFAIGTTQVVYDFEADGFSFYCTFSVIVEDREPPGISCPDDIEERTRDGENVAMVFWSIPFVSDNSGGESIIPQLTEGPEPGSDFVLGEHVVTYLATDETGNQNSCTFIVLVVDEEQPQLQCPHDITVETLETESMAAANWERIEADDNSGGGVIVTAEPPSGTRFQIGINSVSVIAVDSSNNEASCAFIVTVIDSWPPTIHCPGDLSQETDIGLDSSLIEWTITADDNSQDILIISGQLGSENTFPERESPLDYQYSFPIGETRVTFEASDTSMNTMSCSFDVVVQDNELPKITCPEDILQATDPGVNTARVSWVTPEAFDNSYVVMVVTVQYSPGEEFYLTDSPIIVMYRAVDGSGNTETCSFMIVLEDREIPRFINCPDDITETAAELASDAVVSWNPPRTKDNSNPYTSDDPPDGTTVIATMQPGDSFQLGVTEVNYTATDEAGNVAVCSFDVTVQGPDLPNIICPEDVISPTDSGTNNAVILLLNQVSVSHPVENIQNIIIESDAPSGNEYYIGVSEVTFTATDSSGNTDSCTVSVTVQDEEPPGFTQCPESVEQNLPSRSTVVEIMWDEPSAFDNSGIPPTVSSTRMSGDSFPVGEFTVEYTATDESGNMGSCSFRIIVEEFIPTTTVKAPTTTMLSSTIAPTTTIKHTTTMSTTKLPVDPCAENGLCPIDSICQVADDTEVICVCQSSGFSWNIATNECTDVNECLEPSVCPDKSQCDNTDGSYECICDVGFVLQGSTSGDQSCVDINECEDESQNDCDINAVCMNNAGSFTCICKEEDNFRGNGKTCVAVNPCNRSPCNNDGTCVQEDSDDGFACECPTDKWMGRTCDIEIKPVGEPRVLQDPRSQTSEAFETVRMTARFQNIEQIRWLHNSAPLSEFNDQSTLQIFRVAAGDEGYYHAVGIGTNGQVETEKALLQINGLGIFPAGMTFDIFYDKEALLQIEQEIVTFIANGIEDSPKYSGDQAPVPILNDTSPGSVKASMKIYQYNITQTKYPDTRNVLVQVLLDIAYNSNGYLDPDSISVDSTVTCFESTWKSSYGLVTFPTSLVGETVFSLENCPWYTRNDGEPIAYANCRSDLVSPAELVPINNCGGNLTVDEQLAKLDALMVTPDNLQEVTREVEQLTSESNQVQADGVASVANILVEVANLNSPDPEVASAFIETLDNLFNVDDEYLEMAQEQEGSINKAVQALETQLQNVQLSIDGSYRGNSENIVVEVREVMPEDIQRGIGFGSFSTEGSEDNDDEVIMILENSDTVESAKSTATALIVLSQNIFDQAMMDLGESDAMIRVTFVIYEEDTLFKSRTNKVFNDEQDEVDRAVNTRIVSCTVGNQAITNLQEPVEIAFKILRNSSDALNRSCVFWDFTADGGLGDWSSEGCYLSNTTGETGENVECKCNHLTNFAVLMDIHGQSTLTKTQDLILEILSYIGCGLSIIGLAATIYSYAAQPKLRSKQPNKILLNLCTALLGLYSTFIVMIAIDTKRNEAEVGLIPCSILAGLIQFFTLASLFWMGVEGVNMYLLFVRVVNSYISKFMLKAALAAWGVPLVVVAVTGAATREEYLIEGLDFCFLRQYPLIGGLLVPIGLVILFNIVVYVLVLRRITASVEGKVETKTNKEKMKKRLINATCIFVLMGLTWGVGYLSVIQATSFIVQMLFCVLNSMQGYVIFMLYVMRRADVRQVLTSQFHLSDKKKSSGFSSNSPQSSPRARPRNRNNQPQTDSRQFSGLSNGHGNGDHPDTSFAPTSFAPGPAPGPVPDNVFPGPFGSLNGRGARSRSSFAPATVPVSTVEANRMNGSVNGSAAPDLDDSIDIDSDNDDFDINRINEGIDNPAGPNTYGEDIDNPDGPSTYL
ncbi:uncharacterized protein [Amphiura filiformis]|uniref:uncharacterized protein n=1 Tax=Amphiura filiformis TaxID=82378 RepID=UPI003B20E125